MISINPYLNFKGNTEEAMNFYKSVLGGEFSAFQRFNDSPGFEKMLKEEQGKMMHISLPLGKGNALMATDVLESMEQEVTAGNNMYLSINAESLDEARRLFDGLSTGGKIEMLFGAAFWGGYLGVCTDKLGIQWMINYDPNQTV